MSRSLTVIFVALVLILSIGLSQETPKVNPDIAQTLQTTVRTFLDGKDTKSIITIVSDGEFNQTVQNPQELYSTYHDCKFEFAKISFSPDAQMAIMTLKTKSKGVERWHTFGLMLNTKSKWAVTSWHSSHV